MVIFSTEFFAVILSFLAIALLLSNQKYANLSCGILLLLIILLKIITIIFIPIVIISWILITQNANKNKILYCVYGFCGFLLAFTLMCITTFKNFIPDTLLMPLLSDPGSELSILTRLYLSIMHSIGIWWFIPILPIGIFVGLIVFYGFIHTNKKLFLLLFSILWFCPLVTIFIQSEWPPHHYAGLIITSVISIILFLSTNYKEYSLIIIALIIAVIMILFGLTCSVWQDTHKTMWDDHQIKDSTTMKNQFNLSDQSSLLYLDVGVNAYFIGVPGACRETYPLVIRIGYKNNLKNKTAYINAKKCIIDYNGTYLLYDGGIEDPDIASKINLEYTKVYNGTPWHTVYPPTDLYKKNIANQIGSKHLNAS
jgi:hypothetical protein